ncbi:MAG TPA: hypothetical protein VFG04_09940, partial [Planctomycetaceae bacterium]|nr:hypothetical protein [Planctomycetaceae bacterium]
MKLLICVFRPLVFVLALGISLACPNMPGQSLGLAAEPTPLIRAHAHNDYEHKRPLFDALDQGLCSVEADIFLVDGQLLVGHT